MYKQTSRSQQFLDRGGSASDRISRRGYQPDAPQAPPDLCPRCAAEVRRYIDRVDESLLQTLRRAHRFASGNFSIKKDDINALRRDFASLAFALTGEHQLKPGAHVLSARCKAYRTRGGRKNFAYCTLDGGHAGPHIDCYEVEWNNGEGTLAARRKALRAHARGVAEERERCAKIAEEQVGVVGRDLKLTLGPTLEAWTKGYVHACEKLAEDIRAAQEVGR